MRNVFTVMPRPRELRIHRPSLWRPPGTLVWYTKLRGDEVAQLYIRDEVSSVTRPVKELRGFRRVTLDPGETRTVEFTLGPPELSFLNREMQRVVEPGSFKIMIGGSSDDLIETTLNVVARQP
jgi:beta-glucosidase